MSKLSLWRNRLVWGWKILRFRFYYVEKQEHTHGRIKMKNWNVKCEQSRNCFDPNRIWETKGDFVLWRWTIFRCFNYFISEVDADLDECDWFERDVPSVWENNYGRIILRLNRSQNYFWFDHNSLCSFQRESVYNYKKPLHFSIQMTRKVSRSWLRSAKSKMTQILKLTKKDLKHLEPLNSTWWLIEWV